MLDHMCLNVRDFQKSKEFYRKLLEPLGIKLLSEPMAMAAGFGREGMPAFWLAGGRKPLTQGVHIAFTAASREEVDACYEMAMAAGAKDNGKPGLREIYHPHYYGAFFLDPDGNNIEAVCHKPV